MDEEPASDNNDTASTSTDTASSGQSSPLQPRYEFTKEGMSRLLADLLTNRSPMEDIRLVLRAGADVNFEVAKGLRPIHYAAFVNYTEAVEFLLDNGADMDIHDAIGYAPLHIAAKHGNKETVRLLVERGACVNYCDGGENLAESSRTLGYLTVDPLNLAIDNNHPECVEILLLGGASPNHKYFLGYEINMAPLHNLKCLELILQYGAEPDAMGRNGLSPLMRACREQNLDAVRLLLKFGAAVDLLPHSRFEQKTALYYAVMGGNIEITRILLEAGASTRRFEDFRYSPLEYAITQSKYEICQLFLAHGVDVNEENGDSASPLQVACSINGIKDQLNIVKLLLQNGAHPNKASSKWGFSYSDNCSLTPLVEYLSCYGYLHDFGDLMHLLLQYGAWVNVTLPYERYKVADPNGVLHIVRKISLPDYIFNIIIEAAYVFDLEAIKSGPIPGNRQAELLHLASNPRSLRHLVRIKLQKCLRLPVPDSVQSLPLPSYLKDYVRYTQ